MKAVSTVISIHSSDTAGVCSALYELGGMTVVHDASGCNSTYATHDEPRWYGGRGMVCISGLTEAEAIMGDDDAFIGRVVRAAEELGTCRFIAICGSPMPMMVGTDFDALAKIIAGRTSIPVIPLHTNGMRSYLAGISESFTALAERFCREDVKKCPGTVNVLGATPLDFSVNGQVESICAWLREEGFQLRSCWAMGNTLDELSLAAEAEVNLVISSGALAAGAYFERRFGIPFVTGVPVGEKFAARLARALREAARSGRSFRPCLDCRGGDPAGPCIIGETVMSASLACALELERALPCRVLDPLEPEFAQLGEGDLSVPDEEAVAAAFAEARAVAGDPLYRPVVPAGRPFIPLPHEAFSGRCFRKEMKNLIGRNFAKEFPSC